MTTTKSILVGGEPVTDLLETLQGFEIRDVDDHPGMSAIGGTVGPSVVRALFRLEAELLLADADQLSASTVCGRTYDQRRADAFLLLMQRVADAPQ